MDLSNNEGARLMNAFVRQYHAGYICSPRHALCASLLQLGGAYVKMPSLHVFVLNKQNELLNWYVTLFNIDLAAPIHSDAELLLFAETLSWMRDTDGNNFASDLSIAKFLCALAATTEAFETLSWILCKHLKCEKFTIHGFNLLQLAAMHGCYITIKACYIYRGD